jgi:serine protease Do
LFNLKGEVIGINTAIYSPTGGSVGIGFAIPSTLANRVIKQLAEFGRTRRGWLGVRIQTVTDEIAVGLGLDKAAGALVAGVGEDGPAGKAGIQQGDVILRFDGKEVDEMRALPRIVAETRIGKTVKVDAWRRGESITLEVTIAEMEESDEKLAQANEEAKPELAKDVKLLGMRLSTLTEEARESFKLDEAAKGVLVLEVAAESSAAKFGLRPGDLIVEVQQTPVTTPGDVTKQIAEIRMANKARKSKKVKSVLLLVQQRTGNRRFVAVQLDEDAMPEKKEKEKK